jgi:hypothetical protein
MINHLNAEEHTMTKAHGLISLSLFFISQVLALTVTFVESQWLGLGYALLLVVSSLSIVYAYCAKCPVRLTNCGHVIIGPVTRIFLERKSGSYTRFEYGVVLSALLLLILVPQFWLWQHPRFLISFWIALIIAGLEINRYVCTRCDNVHCIACRKKGMAPSK